MKVKVTQSCPTLCDPVDCSLPGSSVNGILQARILKWVTVPFSRWSSQPRDWTHVSHIAGGFFTVWATRGPSKQSIWFLQMWLVPSCLCSLLSAPCKVLHFLSFILACWSPCSSFRIISDAPRILEAFLGLSNYASQTGFLRTPILWTIEGHCFLESHEMKGAS